MSQSKNKLIAPYISDIFKGVRPGWKKILLSPKLKPIIQNCFNKLGEYLAEKGVTSEHLAKNGLGAYIRPKPTNILEAFKYFDPNNLTVIIIGQDPYPKPEDAQGLCFSAPKRVKTPKSLQVIYKCLEKSECITETPDNGELVNWAKQGVLMLNRYLTRSPNIKKNDKDEIWVEGNGDSSAQYLHKFWDEFTSALLQFLTGEFIFNHSNHYLAILLWGTHAKELSTYIDAKVQKTLKNQVLEEQIMEWCHPINMIPESDPAHFINCDHFIKVNDALVEHHMKPIDWDPCVPAIDALLSQFYYCIETEALEYIDNNPANCYNDGTNNILNKKVIQLLKTKKPEQKSYGKIIEVPSFDVTAITLFPIVATISARICESGTEEQKPGSGRTEEQSISYDVYFPEKFLNKNNGISDRMQINGKVSKKTLKLDQDFNLVDYVETPGCLPIDIVTVSRGELLSLIIAFIQIIKEYNNNALGKKSIIIITNSAYVLNMINIKIWKLLKTNPELDQVKTNHDLLLIIRDLLYKLAEIVPNSTQNIDEIQNILIQREQQNLSWGGLTMIYIDDKIPENFNEVIALAELSLNREV